MPSSPIRARKENNPNRVCFWQNEAKILNLYNHLGWVTRKSELVGLLTRAGVVIGVALVLLVIIPQIRHSSIAEMLLEQIPAARRSAQASPAEGRVSPAASQNGFSGLNAQFGARHRVAPVNNSEILEAAKFIVPAPPQTELGLRGVDPSLLQANFQRGLIAMKSGMDAENGNGAHLISLAGVLGYQPARFLIVQEYPSSAALRSVVSSLEAVR